MDRRILMRAGLVLLMIAFVLLIGKLTILAFTRNAHDSAHVERAELEASGAQQKSGAPVDPAK